MTQSKQFSQNVNKAARLIRKQGERRDVLIEIKDINQYKIPPNFQQAQCHRDGLFVGPDLNYDLFENLEQKFCECCARQTNKQVLDLDSNLNDFSFLGAGYPLYFVYVKYSIILLIVMFICSGIYSMISNSKYGNDCKSLEDIQNISKDNDQEICVKNWITYLSIGNIVSNRSQLEMQGYINLATVFIIIVMLQIFRYTQRLADQECDDNDISCEDYTILIKNIPRYYDAINDDYDDDLKDFLQKNGLKDQICDVQNVNLCFDLEEVINCQKKIDQLIEKKQKTILKERKNNNQNNQKLEQIELQIQKVICELQDLQQKLSDGKGKQFMSKYFVGWALVSFETEKQKEDIILQYKQNLCSKSNQLVYHGNKLEISQAPAPSDIYWNNLHVKTYQKFIYRIVGKFLQLIMLGLFLSGILVLNTFQQQSVKNQNQTDVFLFSLLVSLVVTIFNSILQISQQIITKYEYYSTRTIFNINLAKSLSIAMFINTSITPFILQIFIYRDHHYTRIFGLGGLAENQNQVLITNIIFPNLIALLDLQYLIKKIIRRLEIQKGTESVLTQEQLNFLFEDPEFQISNRFAVLLNTLFTTAFYSSILPLGMIWGILSMILHYWVDKYTLLRKSCVKFNQSALLSIEMTEQLEYFLPIYSLSNITFFYYSTKEAPQTSYIISMVIGIIHCFLPMQWLNTVIFKIPDPQPNSVSYSDAEILFNQSYARENPVTKEIEKAKYKNKMNLQKEIRRRTILVKNDVNLIHIFFSYLEDAVQIKIKYLVKLLLIISEIKILSLQRRKSLIKMILKVKQVALQLKTQQKNE